MESGVCVLMMVDNGLDWRMLLAIELLLGTGGEGSFASRTRVAVSVACGLTFLVAVGKVDNCVDAIVVNGLSLLKERAAFVDVSFVDANNAGCANVVFGNTLVAATGVAAFDETSAGTSLDAKRVGSGVTRSCADAIV